LERRVVLSVLDRKWREHLYEMDYLKEGIGLRAMAQRDPLIEYQREGFDMFGAMLEALKEESVGFLFNLQVQITEPEAAPEQPPSAVASGMLADAASGPAPVLTGNGSAYGQARGQRPADTVPPALRARGLGQPEQRQLTYTAPTETGDSEVRGA